MTVNKYQSRTRFAHWLAAVLLLGSSLLAEAVPIFTTLHNFTGLEGKNPHGLLVQGRDFNLYGTTDAFDQFATAFKITPAGAFSVLHTFSGSPTAAPSTLMLGLDGNFYGTTTGGNTLGGKIFKMTPAGVVAELHTFGSVPNDGFSIDSPLNDTHPTAPVQASDGTLYGTTNRGGTNGAGIIYQLTSTGVYTILHHFKAGLTDGSIPLAPMIIGKDGNLYGTTSGGGVSISGTVFKYRLVSTSAVQLLVPAFSILHSFTVADGGVFPAAPLIQGVDGNFYGTTNNIQAATGTYGNIFRITPSGAYTTLHVFDKVNAFASGYFPSGLVQASDGNFYGATSAGGKPLGGTPQTGDAGVLFKMTPRGIYSVLHQFDRQTEGFNPWESLAVHTNGKLYGTTWLGKQAVPAAFGSIFSLDVAAPPFVSVQPNTGKVGGTVGLFGNLTGITTATFNGVTATIAGAANTFRVATIPAGPATGLVKANRPTGVLSSFKTFFVKPTFTSISPASGPVGTSVILKGASLSQTTAVSFIGASAAFTVNNDSQLTVTVPVGAKTGGVVITTKGGSTKAIFDPKFTVTP